MRPNTQTQSATASDNASHPNWIAKAPRGEGRKQKLQRIGAAWNRDDGGICIRLYGTQVIPGDVYLYPNEEMADQTNA